MGSVAVERTRADGDVARNGTPMLPGDVKMRGGPAGAEPSLMVELESSVVADGAPLSCAIEETPLSIGIAIDEGPEANPLIIGAAMGAAI